MDLPPELIVLITTNYLTSKIDQLSFLVSHEHHFLAFFNLASTTALSRFCSEFQLERKQTQDLEFSDLLEIYRGLRRICGNDGNKKPFLPTK